jgi:hypothetical protein
VFSGFYYRLDEPSSSTVKSDALSPVAPSVLDDGL